MKKYRPFIISFAITFAAAVIGGIVTYSGMESYSRLIQPPLSPPAFLFPVVWTVLYALMAFGAARVYRKTGTVKTAPLYAFAVQLVLNVGWSIVFFGLGLYCEAFVWLLILLAAVIVMTVLFYRTDRLSGLLQIPYILWLAFAAYLNLSICIINFA